MGDQLERFIIENRGSFDETEPSEEVWKTIDKKLGKKQRFLQTAWKVAAMLFMASTLYLLMDSRFSTDDEPAFTAEFQQAETYYVQMINQKKIEIEQSLTPEQQQEFLSDINQLDSMYDELKSTYAVNASNQRIVDAMINNLQLRLKILESQLDILSEIKKNTNENETDIQI